MAGLYEPTALDHFLTGLGPFATFGLVALISLAILGIFDLYQYALDCRASRVTSANRIHGEDGVQPSCLYPAEDPGGAGAAAVAGLRQSHVTTDDVYLGRWLAAWRDARGVVH